MTELLDLIGTRDYQKQHHVLGVLAQEHQRRGVRYDLLVEQLWRNGWSMVGSQATSGPGGGDSAGTAILSLKGHAPVGKLEGIVESPDISPPDGPGRITAGFMSSTVFPCSGCLIINAYFHVNEGLCSIANLKVLNQIADLVIAFQGPWILGADFNSTPSQFREQLGEWLGKVRGRVHAPDEERVHTCKSGRLLDFFVASTLLDPIIHDCIALEEFECKAHRPVALRMHTHGIIKNPLVTRRSQPRPFPRVQPQQPCRQFEVDNVGLQEAELLAAVACSSNGMGVAYKRVAEIVEVELAQRFDCIDEKTCAPNIKYIGRGNEYGTFKSSTV